MKPCEVWTDAAGRQFQIEKHSSGSHRFWLYRVGLAEWPHRHTVRGFKALRDAVDYRDALGGDNAAAARWYARAVARLAKELRLTQAEAAREIASTAARAGFSPTDVNADPATGIPRE